MGKFRPFVAVILMVIIAFVLVANHETGQAAASQRMAAPYDVLDQLSTTSTVTAVVTSTSTSLTSTTLTTSTSATFTAPSLALNPDSGSIGLTVQVSGSGYHTSDSSCTISGDVVASPSCSVSGGALSGSFMVANVTFGAYTVTATGNQIGDSASATFTVNTAPPSLTLNPSVASPNTVVQVLGSGFSSTDTSCSLSGTPVIQVTCSITSGGLTGSFKVGNVASGFYTITATGNPGGDVASANFQVTPPVPTITLNPATDGVGATVQVSGSGFSTTDSSCSLSGGAAAASETCSVSGGSVSASFVVATTSSGSYTITVSGAPAGDSASATFTLIVSPISIGLSPSGASPGASVQVTGSGFSLADSSCSISGGAVTSPICSISGGTISGSFTVANVAAGYYTVTVTGSTDDSASANFAVGPGTVPAIPGFPDQAILTGLLLGLAAVALLRRRRM